MSVQVATRRGSSRPLRRVLVIGACAGLLLAVGFGGYAYRAAHNMPDVEAADEIAAAGGGYQRDSIAPVLCVLADGWVLEYGPVVHVWYRAPLTEAKMSPLAKLDHLEELTVIPPIGPTGAPVTSPVAPSDRAAWRWLAELQSLRRLSIQTSDIRDEDLAHLEKLPRLRRIDLWGNPNLTPAGVDRLRRARPDVHINYP